MHIVRIFGNKPAILKKNITKKLPHFWQSGTDFIFSSNKKVPKMRSKKFGNTSEVK